MRTVFILQHERPESDEMEGDVKLIGVYSSQHSAQAAVARLRSQSGFSDHPEDFHIDEYEIDKDHWSKGFVMS